MIYILYLYNMEFKIGDKVNIHPDSAYLLQGMKDMDGVIIKLGYFWHTVIWENDTSNLYESEDLILSVKVQEHRDKQLNDILDGI
jgi:hypothetical protein